MTYEEKLKHQIYVEKARMILKQQRGWEADRNEPPSLRDGWRQPSAESVAWARAVLELERQEQENTCSSSE